MSELRFKCTCCNSFHDIKKEIPEDFFTYVSYFGNIV